MKKNGGMNRRRFLIASAALVPAFFPAPAIQGRNVNERLRLAVIGLGRRGTRHLSILQKMDGLEIAGICDPDALALGKAREKYPSAKPAADMRTLFDDKNIDAAIVATCNHWHALAAIWAMSAEKDVYIEKPLTRTFFEARQIANAVKKYGRLCQVGTQLRALPDAHAEVKRFLHEEKALGKILSVRINRFCGRKPIGKRNRPLEIPPTVDYNLWLGPAKDEPIYRDSLQYDWHWVWNTGCGEAGNWGSHLLDDCRNDILLDEVGYPTRFIGGGARVGYNDAGETPNTQFTLFETGSFPIVLGISNLPDKNDPRSGGACRGPWSGYVAYCEGGRYEKTWDSGQYTAVAYDNDNKLIRKFSENPDTALMSNFLRAVRAGDASMLYAPIETGLLSAGWYHAANAAFRVGRPYSKAEALSLGGTDGHFAETLDDMEKHLAAQGIDMSNSGFTLSDYLGIDPATERFTGDGADRANALYNISFREPFAIPDLG